MIKIDKLEVWGWEHTIRGMRNPMNSWDKTDSYLDQNVEWGSSNMYKINSEYKIGPNDLKLMRNLYKASLDNNFAHRKFLRQIMISFDITAPLYWWKEFDTYKVGTTANSTSTMHKIHSKEFTRDDFSHEHLMYSSLAVLDETIEKLNYWRDIYLNGGGSDEDPTGQTRRIFEPKDKEVWWQLIQLLPSTFNQTRTITMNYENAVSMIKQRTGHKLDEWNIFVDFLKDLPYLKEITSTEE